MSKLRLDYFLNFGIELVDGDIIVDLDGGWYNCCDMNVDLFGNGRGGCKRFIKSFAPRKNTGEQPCVDDVQVVAVVRHGRDWRATAKKCDWSIDLEPGDIKTWKPDLDALIKLQDEHDKKQSKPNRTKTEFVKVDKNAEGGKYWECARDFAEGGCEFFADGNKYLPVTNNDCLLANYKAGLLYRKVENEATWQDEVKEYLSNCKDLTECVKLVVFTSKPDGGFCEDTGEWIRLQGEFIGLCHLVAELADKPE